MLLRLSSVLIGYLITIYSIESLHVKENYVAKTVQAIEHLLNFFESDAKDLNADGLYGLRVAQGQLQALQESLSTEKDTRAYTNNQHPIQSLIEQIERIANRSLIEIDRQNPDYLHRFSLLMSRPFRIDYEPRPINHKLITTAERDPEFDEDESDKCFGELMGTNEAQQTKQCYTSQRCWTMMTSPLKKDYRITHQLLWFLIAKNIGCLDHQSNSMQANRNLRELEDRFCANIYQDAVSNYENNENQDLFLEQILLCSIIGYEEFLKTSWLKIILTWQDPLIGCFSDNSETMNAPSRMRRHLLIEQEMADGCLSHKSGLAAGVLAVYIRAFLQ